MRPAPALRVAALVALGGLVGGAGPACAPARAPLGSTTATATSRYLTHDGVDLFVRSVGGGDPRGLVTVIALHGGPGYSHDYLAPLEQLTSPRLRVVTFDQRGAGRSHAPATAGLALSDQVGDVEAVRAATGAERVVVLGHSWGGFLAEAYAVAHPERLAGLVIVDAMPNREVDLAPVIARAHARRDALVAEGLLSNEPPRAEGDDCRAPMNAELPVDFADPRHPGARALGGTACSARVGAAVFASLGHYDLAPRLASVSCPVLLVYGDADANTLTVTSLTREFSSARVDAAILPSCGHYPFIECPAPFFAKVGAFLDALRP